MDMLAGMIIVEALIFDIGAFLFMMIKGTICAMIKYNYILGIINAIMEKRFEEESY